MNYLQVKGLKDMNLSTIQQKTSFYLINIRFRYCTAKVWCWRKRSQAFNCHQIKKFT